MVPKMRVRAPLLTPGWGASYHGLARSGTDRLDAERPWERPPLKFTPRLEFGSRAGGDVEVVSELGRGISSKRRTAELKPGGLACGSQWGNATSFQA